MSPPRFTPEFKDEAVRQIIERGYSVAEVSARLGVSAHSLYKWINAVKPDKTDQRASELLAAKSEILRLRAQLHRSEDERDMLKKAALDSTGHCNAAFSVSAGQSYPNVFRGLPLSFEATSLSCSWV